jgi:hypothetical protein
MDSRVAEEIIKSLSSARGKAFHLLKKYGGLD